MMAAALPDLGWPRGNCPILLLATTVHRSFHHHRLLPGLRPSSTQRKDVLCNPDSPCLLRTLRRGDRCFSGDRFSMRRPRPPQGACNRRGQPSAAGKGVDSWSWWHARLPSTCPPLYLRSATTTNHCSKLFAHKQSPSQILSRKKGAFLRPVPLIL